ncbi:type II secretion system F family protein [Promicromonospora sp. MS192]|uniref:type II secretion system F family protein n=1 Tax=Promicromonospora sp. MS192 TaxID=3412684 RepID=UPI003C2F52A1
MIVLVAACGAIVVAGILVLVSGLSGAPARPERPAPPAGLRRLRAGLARVPHRTWLLVGIGLVGGVAAWGLTGWGIMLLVVPAAVAGLPHLLSTTEAAAQIARLDAMEEWTRSLAGVLITGRGLEGALTATLRSVPAPIAPQVRTLVDRLHSQTSTREAIWAFADDLDDPTGDLIAANLLLAAQRGGQGLATILNHQAQAVAADVRAQRQIQADRAKDRTTVRIAVVASLIVLAVLPFTGTYAEPYTTPLGQAVLLVLIVADVVLLLALRKMAAGQPRPRILVATGPGSRPA